MTYVCVYMQYVHTVLSNSQAPACPRHPQPHTAVPGWFPQPRLENSSKTLSLRYTHIFFHCTGQSLSTNTSRRSGSAGLTVTTPLKERVIPSCWKDQRLQTLAYQCLCLGAIPFKENKPNPVNKVSRIQPQVSSELAESAFLRTKCGEILCSVLFQMHV